jgi:hypothetical protein
VKKPQILYITGKIIMKSEVDNDIEAGSLGSAANTTLEIIPK